MTLGYRAQNKEQRARAKKDAEIAMNHLDADQMLKKGSGVKAGDKEELAMDGQFMHSEAKDEYSDDGSDGFGSESEGGSESGEEGSGSQNSALEQPASEDFEATPED